MSDNIIKWNYVKFDDEDKRVVKPSPKNETLASTKYGQEIMKQFHIASAQDLVDVSCLKAPEGKGSFQEGIPIVNYDEVMEDQKKRIAEEADSLLSDAKKKAETLLAEASSQAETIRQAAQEEGREEGRREAAAAAEQESKAKNEEYERRRAELEEEYLAQAQNMEPFFADLVAQMVEKVTGIVVEGKKDIILHLISQGIEEAGRSHRFFVHVSPEDYPFVEEQRERILQEIPDASLDIIEDAALLKNQCLIETDSKVIDSSLDIQIRNLTEDLKLLSLSEKKGDQ